MKYPLDHFGHAYNKCIKVINSCENTEHLDVAGKMVFNYHGMFGYVWTAKDLYDRLEMKGHFFYSKNNETTILRQRKPNV